MELCVDGKMIDEVEDRTVPLAGLGSTGIVGIRRGVVAAAVVVVGGADVVVDGGGGTGEGTLKTEAGAAGVCVSMQSGLIHRRPSPSRRSD